MLSKRYKAVINFKRMAVGGKKLETKTTEKNCGEIHSWRFWPKVYS